MVNFFFDGWEPVARIVLVGTLAYTALVVLLRVSGKRTLLLHRGRVLHGALRRERLTEKELDGAVRKHGLGSLQEAEAVVLEADGSLSVVGPDSAGDGGVLPGEDRP